MRMLKNGIQYNNEIQKLSDAIESLHQQLQQLQHPIRKPKRSKNTHASGVFGIPHVTRNILDFTSQTDHAAAAATAHAAHSEAFRNRLAPCLANATAAGYDPVLCGYIFERVPRLLDIAGQWLAQQQVFGRS